MGGFITVLVLIALFYILWLCMPWIRRKAQQKMAEKVEDYLRSATGMPPREKKKKSRNPFRRTEIRDDGDNVAYRSQEQVEDAEWIEIKEPKKPGRK